MTKTPPGSVTVYLQYLADKSQEERKMSMMGLVVDWTTNSRNKHHKNCMVDSNEDY